MPLDKGKSDEAKSKNIAELIKAGYSMKQACAIAYSVAGESKEPKDKAAKKASEKDKK